MNEKPVDTVAGPFDRRRTNSLRQTLLAAEAEGMHRDDIINFEGQALLISFGQHMLDFIDLQFAKRNNEGL